MTNVRDKRVIVTGGANGIGFQCCHQLLLNGSKIVSLMDLPELNGQTSAKKLNDEFGNNRALFFPSDVTKFDAFEVAFKNAIKSMGGLDLLINNAGILNEAMWEKEIQTNFTSLVKNTLLGYDYMGKHNGGNGGIIVNVASILGLIHKHTLPVYTATKHAVVGFTACLKNHYERTGVSVRVMCPGATDTLLDKETQNIFLSFVDKTKAIKRKREFPQQTAEYVGKAMIELIENGTNGAIWVSQHCEPPFEIQLAEYESIKL